MMVSAHQPQYIPWLGFFHKVSKSDIYVSLNTVQYTSGGFINRNKIKTSGGGLWLIVPVIHKHKCKINEVKINNNINWARKHLSSLKYNYSKSPFFGDYFEDLKKIYSKKWEMLSDFDETLLVWLFKKLGIKIKYLKLSELKVKGKNTSRIINICKKVGTNTYFSGPGGKLYMKEELFKKACIKLLYQNFKHPVYKQMFEGFIPSLSIFDLLFNHGKDSLKIIRGQK